MNRKLENKRKVIKAIEAGLKPIVFAYELRKCDCCDEAWCEVHAMHFVNCPCVGSSAKDTIDIGGVLWGKQIE